MGGARHTGLKALALICCFIACFGVAFTLASDPLGPQGVGVAANEGPILGEPIEGSAPVAGEPAVGEEAPAADPSPTSPVLAEGQHVRYIDRVALPPYATLLYHWLEEATDVDGVDDWLIDDRYFASGAPQGTLEDARIPGTLVSLGDGYAVSLGATNSKNEDEISACIGAAWYAFDRDHPEVFWLDSTYRFGTINLPDGTCCAFLELGTGDWQMRSEGFRSAEAIAQAIATRDAQVGAILGEAVVPGDDGATVRNLDGWLTAHNGYSTVVSTPASVPPASSSCLCALTGQSGEQGPVCEGYARAFKVLCDTAGIPCVLSSGLADDSGEHMWNLVQVDGAWYAMDVTWDDPNASDLPISGFERTDYALVGSGTVVNGRAFSESHQLSNEGPEGVPALTNEPPLSETAHW